MIQVQPTLFPDRYPDAVQATKPTDPPRPCPGIWPGWPMGMGPDQHFYEPPRIAPKGTVPHRVARIKACGNGVVPQQAERAFGILLIADVMTLVPRHDLEEAR